jgi:serine/threonine-protein kinase
MHPIARLNEALAGRYAVAREIGAGGMATVYLARDLKHDRNVALKVLKPELGAVLGVERFLSEIKVTANLQHPNLLPLFDSGEADGLLFYVMPFVEGETLRAKLDREKQLPVDEAVRIATAAASALDYAHKAGVIHRDLKPENILLQSGQPVIADFGIALAVSRAGGQRVTESGLSLGTPQYMSPEQATADRAIDARSDIYSLGAVTYEMLTGEPPHTGNTAQAIISRIISEEPRPVRSSRTSVPVHVEQAVHIALAKLPADRFSDAAKFGAALQGERSGLAPSTGLAVAQRTRARPSLVWAAIAVVVIAGAFVVGKMSVTKPEPRVVRFALKIPPSQALAGGAFSPIAFTPDGSAIVYVGRGAQGDGQMLYYRRLDQMEGRALAGTERAGMPVFSPSGDWIAYRGPDGVYKVSLNGGAPILVSKAGVTGTSWGANDAIFAGSRTGLFSVSATDGARRQISLADTVPVHWNGPWMPLALPDGKNVLGWVRTPTRGADPGNERLVIVRISDGRLTYLDGDALNPVGFAQGYLAFGRSDGTLGVVPFDPERSRSVVDVIPVLESPLTRASGGTAATLSRAGDLAYIKATILSRLLHLDAQGREIGGRADERNFQHPRLSPDGTRIVMGERTTIALLSDLWLQDITSGVLSPLTNGGTSSSPEWTPDGRRVVYVFTPENGGRAEVWWMPADRSGPGERLVAMPLPVAAAIISPDGRYVVVQATDPKTRQNLYSIDLKGDKTPVPLEQSAFNEQLPALSPDGRWLAYQSDETGSFQIYVRPFPAGGAHVQVTADGGTNPRWTKDSRGIVYRRPNLFERAQLTIGANVTVTRRDSVFSGTYADYDLAADGTIWALRPGTENAEIMVVLNWIAEIKARVAKK